MKQTRDPARNFVAGLLLASATAWASSCGPGRGVDLVLRGGSIVTLDGARPWAEALAIEAETIASVGSNVDMDRFIGRETTVIDLEGRTVLPGFHDRSVFFLEGSIGLDRLRLDEVGSVADIQDLLRAYADTHPEAEWILGSGRFGHLLGAGSSPTAADLDAALPDRPVFLEDREARLALVNTTASKRLSVDSGSGLLFGEAIAPIRSRLPVPTREGKLVALRRGIEYAHRFGVTSIETDDADRSLFEELSDRGELHLRVTFVERGQTVLVVTGEAEVRAAMDAFEKSDRMFLRPGKERTLDGLTVVADEDLPRLAALDVTVIAQPYRASIDRVENPRTLLYPWKTLLRSGTRLVFGSHWPRYPLSPFLGIFTVVTRQNLDGKPEGGWIPNERLTLEEAIRAYTGDATLAAGSPADLVVSSENLFKSPLRRLAEVETAMTVFRGRVVYASPSFLPEEMRRHLLNDYNK